MQTTLQSGADTAPEGRPVSAYKEFGNSSWFNITEALNKMVLNVAIFKSIVSKLDAPVPWQHYFNVHLRHTDTAPSFSSTPYIHRDHNSLPRLHYPSLF